MQIHKKDIVWPEAGVVRKRGRECGDREGEEKKRERGRKEGRKQSRWLPSSLCNVLLSDKFETLNKKCGVTASY